MPPVIDQLADLIVQISRPHPVRVAIDGVDAAGKTTLADALVGPVQARGRPVIRGSVDGFHRPRAERYRRRYVPAQQHYLETVRPHELADVVVVNDDPERPRLRRR